LIGARAGAWVLTAALGEGAFARVFLAEDADGRRVAIKVLRPGVAKDPLLLERFRNEAYCGRRLADCPHIVRVHELIDVEGNPALVMDFVDGADLQRLLDRARGPLGVPSALRYAHDTAFALAWAHRNGITHRDVKPSNCLVDKTSGRVFLTDFGIALREGAKRVTRLAIGTRPYMAPEVVRLGPKASGPPSDVYATGVMLYEMLTGRLPFDGRDDVELMQRIVEEPPPRPSAVCALPDGLDELVVRCLSKEPPARLPDGGALFDALLQLRDAIASRGGDAGYLAAATQQEPVAPQQAPSRRVTARDAAKQHGVLIDVTNPLSPVAHPIPAAGLTVGFDGTNQVVVRLPRVSGRHLAIVPRAGGGFVLTDSSTNGTWVRGERVRGASAPVGDGDLFTLGRSPGAPRFLLVLA